jgi:hypothetical protein
MPSTLTIALSRVMTSWLGTSITCSIMLSLLAPDAVDERDDEGEPRPERARISAEALDRVIVALGYDLYAGDDDEDEKDKQENDEDIEAEHRTLPSGVVAMGTCFEPSSPTFLAADKWVEQAPNLSTAPFDDCV